MIAHVHVELWILERRVVLLLLLLLLLLVHQVLFRANIQPDLRVEDVVAAELAGALRDSPGPRSVQLILGEVTLLDHILQNDFRDERAIAVT